MNNQIFICGPQCDKFIFIGGRGGGGGFINHFERPLRHFVVKILKLKNTPPPPPPRFLEGPSGPYQVYAKLRGSKMSAKEHRIIVDKCVQQENHLTDRFS